MYSSDREYVVPKTDTKLFTLGFAFEKNRE